MQNIKTYGIASGIGAKIPGAELGVWKLFYNIKKYIPNCCFKEIFFTNSIKTNLEVIDDVYPLFIDFHKKFDSLYQKKDKYLFITGDHSNAACVWSAVLQKTKNNFGLLWIDSHLDIHTPNTSESKAIHGMPVSSLLGIGDERLNSLTQHHLKPSNLCYIGTNSYEEAELKQLKKMHIKHTFTEDINEDNIDLVFQNAIKHVTKNVDYFGVSLDVDAISNDEMPGTGCYTKTGLKLDWVKRNLYAIANHPKFIGIEITEFNPELDKNNQTFLGIIEIIESIFTKKID